METSPEDSRIVVEEQFGKNLHVSMKPVETPLTSCTLYRPIVPIVKYTDKPWSKWSQDSPLQFGAPMPRKLVDKSRLVAFSSIHLRKWQSVRCFLVIRRVKLAMSAAQLEWCIIVMCKLCMYLNRWIWLCSFNQIVFPGSVRYFQYAWYNSLHRGHTSVLKC